MSPDFQSKYIRTFFRYSSFLKISQFISNNASFTDAFTVNSAWCIMWDFDHIMSLSGSIELRRAIIPRIL